MGHEPQFSDLLQFFKILEKKNKTVAEKCMAYAFASLKVSLQHLIYLTSIMVVCCLFQSHTILRSFKSTDLIHLYDF